MKYLLIFLITFNLQAMPLSEIDTLTVDESLSTLLYRMGKECSRVDNELPFTLGNIDCATGVPTSFELDTALIAYKGELTSQENARLAELARVNNIKTRLASLPRRASMMRTVLGVPNPAAWLRDNISTLDVTLMETKIAQIEALTVGIEAEIVAEAAEKSVISSAKLRMKTADCSSLTNAIIKDMCRILKRR